MVQLRSSCCCCCLWLMQCKGHAYQLKLATILGQVNAMHCNELSLLLFWCYHWRLGSSSTFSLDILVAVAGRDCFCLSVCQSVCCCFCCCMLANKIIDKTNHLRGKSLRPQPIVLGSTASWLTDTQHVRNNLTTKQRGEKTIQNRDKNQTKKSQQNVPKAYSLYICI